jgi:hypothetical protein
MTTRKIKNQKSPRKKANKMASKIFKKFNQIMKKNHNGEFGEKRMKKMGLMNSKKLQRRLIKKDGINLRKRKLKKMWKMMVLMILKRLKHREKM